mgnify:CR=1 FL=1
MIFCGSSDNLYFLLETKLYFVVKFIYDSNKQSAKAKHDVIVYDKKKETVSMATINIIFLEQKKALNYLRETKVSQLR